MSVSWDIVKVKVAQSQNLVKSLNLSKVLCNESSKGDAGWGHIQICIL